jgi:hypothetical protein
MEEIITFDRLPRKLQNDRHSAKKYTSQAPVRHNLLLTTKKNKTWTFLFRATSVFVRLSAVSCEPLHRGTYFWRRHVAPHPLLNPPPCSPLARKEKNRSPHAARLSSPDELRRSRLHPRAPPLPPALTAPPPPEASALHPRIVGLPHPYDPCPLLVVGFARVCDFCFTLPPPSSPP